MIERRIKINRYNLTNEYGIGYTSNTNEPFYFDLEDYNKIKEYTWSARHDVREGRDNRKYYIETFYHFTENGKKKQKRIHLHHLVLDIDDKNLKTKVLIDHKNRICYDCRKANLQVTNLRVNNINKPKQKTNTSGIIGVEFLKRQQKWKSRINPTQDRRETVYLGNSKEEAIIARLAAEYKYYKNDAPQRHLFEQYGITEEFVDNYPQRIIKHENNTSGITGVYKVPNGWIAKISIDKKPREIGRFKTKREAVICRLEAEKKYYKEHLWQKHLWKEYGMVE